MSKTLKKEQRTRVKKEHGFSRSSERYVSPKTGCMKENNMEARHTKLAIREQQVQSMDTNGKKEMDDKDDNEMATLKVLFNVFNESGHTVCQKIR